MGRTNRSNYTGQCFKQIRSKHIPAIRTVVTSVLDSVGDWKFFLSYANVGRPEVPFLLTSCIFGTVMSILVVMRMFLKECTWRPDNCYTKNITRNIRTLLLFEILLEDVPQIVLTKLIKGDDLFRDPLAVFNITTSLYNALFDILDALEPDRDGRDGGDDGAMADGAINDYAEARHMASAY